MKHYVLVHIDAPIEDAFQENEEWQTFLRSYEHLKTKAKPGHQLAANTWLLDRESETSYFAHLVTLAEDAQLKVSVRYLSED